MDDSTKKIITWCVFLIIITGIIIAVYYVFRNGVLGKTFSDLFGSAEGVALAIEKMINSCNKSGWASPKGCPIGFAAIFVGAFIITIWAVCKIRSTWSTGSKNEVIEKLSVVENRPEGELISEVVTTVDSTKAVELEGEKGTEFTSETIKVSIYKNARKISKNSKNRQAENEKQYQEIDDICETNIDDAMANYSTEEQIEMDEYSEPGNPDGINDADVDPIG